MADSTSGVDSSYNNALGGAIKGAAGSSTLDKQAFLNLLVTQFKYQDPLNPMEDKEFVAQLAQFSSLEQLMNVNTGLENMRVLQEKQTIISAASYIGKEVSARGWGVSLTDGVASKIEFAVSEGMSSGTVTIRDANNLLVNTVKLGAYSPGIHDFPWDGLKANGDMAPNGVYTVMINGTNNAGENILVDVSVSGKVTGVSNYDGDQYLTLSDKRVVLLSNVREILEYTAPKPEDPKDPEAPGGGTGGGTGGTEGEGGSGGTGGTEGEGGSGGTGGTEGEGGTGGTGGTTPGA